MGTAEVESALVLHENVAEAAVVGFPHDIKGQGIYAYVTLMPGSNTLRRAAQGRAAQTGAHRDRPDRQPPTSSRWAPGLPKTRSGKIMRRILRKIAADEMDEIGDTSTLADPAVVDDLIARR